MQGPRYCHEGILQCGGGTFGQRKCDIYLWDWYRVVYRCLGLGHGDFVFERVMVRMPWSHFLRCDACDVHDDLFLSFPMQGQPCLRGSTDVWRCDALIHPILWVIFTINKYTSGELTACVE